MLRRRFLWSFSMITFNVIQFVWMTIRWAKQRSAWSINRYYCGDSGIIQEAIYVSIDINYLPLYLFYFLRDTTNFQWTIRTATVLHFRCHQCKYCSKTSVNSLPSTNRWNLHIRLRPLERKIGRWENNHIRGKSVSIKRATKLRSVY